MLRARRANTRIANKTQGGIPKRPKDRGLITSFNLVDPLAMHRPYPQPQTRPHAANQNPDSLCVCVLDAISIELFNIGEGNCNTDSHTTQRQANKIDGPSGTSEALDEECTSPVKCFEATAAPNHVTSSHGTAAEGRFCAVCTTRTLLSGSVRGAAAGGDPRLLTLSDDATIRGRPLTPSMPIPPDRTENQYGHPIEWCQQTARISEALVR